MNFFKYKIIFTNGKLEYVTAISENAAIVLACAERIKVFNPIEIKSISIQVQIDSETTGWQLTHEEGKPKQLQFT